MILGVLDTPHVCYEPWCSCLRACLTYKNTIKPSSQKIHRKRFKWRRVVLVASCSFFTRHCSGAGECDGTLFGHPAQASPVKPGKYFWHPLFVGDRASGRRQEQTAQRKNNRNNLRTHGLRNRPKAVVTVPGGEKSHPPMHGTAPR